MFILVCIISTSCSDEDVLNVNPPKQEILEIPIGFPEITFPEDNQFTEKRWLLGKKLFYDPILSLDSTKSCASCHKQEFAFGDNVAFSPGVKDLPGTRNAPSLANVAYQPYFTREGGVPTLEMQILVPIQEHNEFDFNIILIGERLNKIEEYRKLSQEAYSREPDYFVITRAISTFERTLISGNSSYDRYTYQNNKNALNDEELRGMELFFSDKSSCFKCHSGFNFTNYNFENNGLYENYKDSGRKRLTGKDEDFALFKIPSLRNTSLTAPYMHDGSIGSLEEVIEHYNNGGKNNGQKSNLIKPLNLTENEKADLLAFLKSLTDTKFINNNNFKK